MALRDLLYRGNPGRRAKVAMLHQEVIDCMELNFEATNSLIDVLNTHWPCKLFPIEMNTKGTIKENADVFLTAMKSIQGVLQDINKTLASKLEPALYQKLHDFQETDATKKKILQAVVVADVAIGVVTSGILVKLIYSDVAICAWSQIAAIVARVSISTLGKVVVVAALVGIGLDLILSGIVGAVERKQLEAEIQKLEALVSEFKPASKAYYKIIIEVTVICQQEANNLLKCK